MANGGGGVCWRWEVEREREEENQPSGMRKANPTSPSHFKKKIEFKRSKVI
jgi:hypothetical protein